MSDLKTKYVTIERLNAAWGTQHASWNALSAATEPPDKQKAGEDLKAFYTRLAEEYFRTCREEVQRVAPNQLYLGCRFAWVNDRAAQAAAKYCDVIAYNLYKRDIAEFRLPAGIDKPVIVGEFHFGALDRGLFHPGLQKTANQRERAAMYKSYVQGALRNPRDRRHALVPVRRPGDHRTRRRRELPDRIPGYLRYPVRGDDRRLPRGGIFDVRVPSGKGRDDGAKK